jgi:hypothetical protein
MLSLQHQTGSPGPHGVSLYSKMSCCWLRFSSMESGGISRTLEEITIGFHSKKTKRIHAWLVGRLKKSRVGSLRMKRLHRIVFASLQFVRD